MVLNGRAGEGARASSLHAVAFDFTDGDAVGAGVARAEELAGPIDVLVNNAGMQQRASLLDFPVEGWRRMLDTNLTGAYLVGRAVAAGMVARGRGKIDNVCFRAERGRPPLGSPVRDDEGCPQDAREGHVRRLGGRRAPGQPASAPATSRPS